MLYFAFQQVDLAEAANAILGADVTWLLTGLFAYAISIIIRIARWRLLITVTRHVPWHIVALSLVVGYAVNNLLPARLGELYRAHHLGRAADLPRSAVLGTIVVERLQDGVTALLLLGAGLWFTVDVAAEHELIRVMILAATGIGVISVLGAVFLKSYRRLFLARLPWVSAKVHNIGDAMSAIMARRLPITSGLTLLIWMTELAAVGCVIASVGITLEISGLALTVGAVVLSTLLPTAPGYIGSLQLAFVLVFGALGHESASAIAVATLMQITLLAPLTIVGMCALFGQTIIKLQRESGSSGTCSAKKLNSSR